MTDRPIIPVHPFQGTGPFDGSGLRLVRVIEHLKVLTSEIQTLDSKYFDVQGEYEDDSAWIIGRAVSTIAINPYIGVILGELVHGLRAALDNLTWSLVKLGATPDPQRDRRVQFPMYGSVAQFWKDPKGRMPGVRRDDRAILERYQPYHGGDTTKGHPINFLNDLWNQDKHRTVLPLTVSSTKVDVAPWIVGEGRIIRVENLLDAGSPLERGTEVWRVLTDLPGRHVRVISRVRAQASFEDGQPFGEGIEAIVATVMEVCREFFDKYG